MSCRCLYNLNCVSGADRSIFPLSAPSIFARCSPFPTAARPLSTTKKRNDGPKSRIERLASWGNEIYNESGGFPAFWRVKAREGARAKFLKHKLESGGLILPLSVKARRLLRRRAIQEERKVAKQVNNERRCELSELLKRKLGPKFSSSVNQTVLRGRSRAKFAYRRPLGSTSEVAYKHVVRDSPLNQTRVSQSRRRMRQRISKLRVKYISLSMGETKLAGHDAQGQIFERPGQSFKLPSRAWTISFSLLVARYDPRIGNSMVETKLRLHQKTVSWVKLLLSEGPGVEAISKAWGHFKKERSLIVWRNVMLWALQSSPPLALNILEATYTLTPLPSYFVADSLEYISNYFLSKTEDHDSKAIDNLHRVTRLVVGRRSSLASCISQRTIYLLLKYSTKEQALALFDDFASHGALHHNTSLHFADFMARHGEHNLAFRVVKSLFESGINLSDLQIMSVCATILRSSAANGRGYAESTALLSQMLMMGLRPTLRLCNVILLIAVEGGDHETAFKVFSTIKANGLEPDAYTYSILLKGAELTSNTETIHDIINLARTSENAMSNAHVLSQIILHVRRTQPYESAFHTMLLLYKKYFDTQPLLDLGLKFEQMHESTEFLERKSQSPTTLGLMITAFLERCRDPNIVKGLYEKFRRQAEAGHPNIAPLIESLHACNAFILAFGRSQATLHLCTTVIGDMLRPLPRVVINTKTGKPIQQAQPNVQTWSILLKAFLDHRQSAAAEKILNMMKKRGIEPNQVTWNTLINGYSRMQDIDAAVGTMKRMEMEGWEFDDYTLKGLGKLRDRQNLMAAFERVEAKQHEEMSPKGTEATSDEEKPSQMETVASTNGLSYEESAHQEASYG
ncbi:MAG: hypothetical protein M1836_001577 [Candelina mexicana]|nr:MAG: hypothetical protein M1836_001577 [Candelina mexicana]